MVAVVYMCRAVLITVFTAAVIGKARDRDASTRFRNSIDELGVVPPRLTPVIQGTVLAAEAGSILLLLLPETVIPGLFLAASILIVFTAVVGFSLVSGRQTTCECFGSHGAPFSVRHIVRNLALSTLALVSAVELLTSARLHDVSAGIVLVSIVAGALAGFAFTRWDDLAYVLVGHATDSGRGDAQW